MKIRNVIAVTLLAATAFASRSAFAANVSAGTRRFSAASIPTAKLKKPGRVVISNDHRSITAHRFFGNIREALVSIRSSRSIPFNPFGPAVFDSRASVVAPSELRAAFEEAGRMHGVDPRLVAAVARRESAWNPRAISNKGASGVMQLMPATARYLGVTNVFDARENILGGTRYLRTLLDTFNGDLDLALAAYNAGPGAVAKYRGIPPYRETQAYVTSIKTAYAKSLAASSIQ
jgi:soluble lytic murein transglycosylase-like protein